MSIERLKQSVKWIPGAHWAARQLLHRSQNLDQRPGDWLYHHQIVSWLNNDTLRRQLPPTLRFFAYYCGLQKDFRDRVLGGERVFKAAIAITRLFRLKDYVGLDLGDHKVFLNLYDPRMLHVPNELLSGDSDTCILQEFVSSGDTFVDVGANHGSFSLVAARRVGPRGLIVAIEPQARLATLVEKSLAASAPCRYQVHRIACGDRDGMADFYVPWATSGSAGLFPKFSATAEHRRFSVAVKRFDDAVDWRSFPGQVFIKLDVEGSELAFLRGASSMVTSRQPHIMFEVNPLSMNAAGISRVAIIQCLQDLGYCHYVELHALGEPRELERLDATRQRNIIFVSPAQRAARLAVPSMVASQKAIADNCPGESEMSISAKNGGSSQERPLVSVIIPTHNRARLVAEAITSVSTQQGAGEIFDLEIIVVDDASSDETPEVLRRFVNIRAIRLGKNCGASAARNAGIKVARGKYLAFLDDDDLFLPHKLKAQVPLLESRPDIGLVYGQISISGEASCDAWPESAPSGNVFGELLFRTDDFMSPDAILVRREAFEKSGGFDESLPTMEHYDMYVRLAFHVPFLFVPGVVAHGRYSQTGKWHTNVKNRNNERVLPRIVERALAMLPNDAASEAVRRKARVAVFSTIAGQRWETEDVREVRDHLIRTLDQYPWMLSQPECVENLYKIAGQLALGSSAPIAAVRAFWQQVKAAAPVFNAMQQLQQRRLLATIWRGAAHASWSVRSYQAAVSAASRAVLSDPVWLTRALFFKR